MKNLNFILLFLVLFGSLSAQELSQNTNRVTPCLNRNISVVFHVVEDDSSATVLTDSLRLVVDSFFIKMNEITAPGCLTFNMCKLNYVPNWQFDTIRVQEHWEELLDQHRVPARLNVFYIKEQNLSLDPCGYGSFDGVKQDTGGILLVRNAVCNERDLAHQIGHYLGLMNTFGDGDEVFSRTDMNVGGDVICEVSGDKLCDTEADNFVEGDDPKTYYSDEMTPCRFTNSERDSRGQYYDPDLGNIMSNYEDCRCRFSNQQYQVIGNSLDSAIVKPY